jgi:hypothetical protein
MTLNSLRIQGFFSFCARFLDDRRLSLFFGGG